MSCDDIMPVFLIYNYGNIDGFGWAFDIELRSQRYEITEAKLFTVGIVGNIMGDHFHNASEFPINHTFYHFEFPNFI